MFQCMFLRHCSNNHSTNYQNQEIEKINCTVPPRMKCYVTIKEKEILVYATAWRDLKYIVVDELNHILKLARYMSQCIWNSGKGEIIGFKTVIGFQWWWQRIDYKRAVGGNLGNERIVSYFDCGRVIQLYFVYLVYFCQNS